MRVLTIIAIAMLAAGCIDQRRGDHRNITRAEAAVVAKAEEMWTEAGLEPIGEQCRSDRAHLRVVVAQSDAQWTRLTGLCPPLRGQECAAYQQDHDCRTCAHSMLRYVRVGVWPAALSDANTHPIVYVHHSAPTTGAMAHEWFHIAEHCTGRGRSWHGDPDGPYGPEPAWQGPVWGDDGLYLELQRWALHEVEE